MDVKWLMFDVDNTLLDFKKACEDGLKKTFTDFDSVLTDEIEMLYESINSAVWREFEQGKIDAVSLRSVRFSRLFDELGIQPAHPSEFGAQYLKNLVYCSEAYDGLDELLKSLKPEYLVSIITNGLKEVQRPRLSKLGLTDYFDSIIVSDEIGVAKPQSAFFDLAYKSLKHDLKKEQVMVVGDNIVADIEGGNGFGFQTCWISHGKHNHTDIKPDIMIEGIHEFHKVLNFIEG